MGVPAKIHAANSGESGVDRRGLVTSMVVTLLFAVITNGLLAAFGFNRRGSQHWPSFAPPGPTIGAIWVVLFAALGAARALALRVTAQPARTDARAVTGLIVICLAYPFYTHFIGGHATELVGNAVTFAYAAWLAVRLRSRSPIAALIVGVVAAWVAFATVLVFALVGLNGWAT